MTTCLGIRNATRWADTRSIERISCFIIIHVKQEAYLRRENVQLRRESFSVLAKCDWETISCGHYRFVFTHCDVIGMQSYRIR